MHPLTQPQAAPSQLWSQETELVSDHKCLRGASWLIAVRLWTSYLVSAGLSILIWKNEHSGTDVLRPGRGTKAQVLAHGMLSTNTSFPVI